MSYNEIFSVRKQEIKGENANTTINEGCIISVGAIVDHDVIVEKYCHVNVGSICKAGCVIETSRKLETGEVVLGY